MTSPERDDRVPQQIGPYQVEGLLGRGGMGEVYRGFDQRLDRPVALKRVRPSSDDPQRSRARFRREARVVARLSHSAIVQVHDWVEEEDDLWIVMELAEGQPLRQLMDRGPLAPARAARIVRRIASGLAVAHDSGVVHRDLKAENVMLAADDAVKILDFGLAKLVRADGDQPDVSLSASGQILGTVRYLSPEQALGHPVDHRSDLFSLGTLLYEMLTGVSPFKGTNAVETLSRICTLEPEPVARLTAEVPPDLARLVHQLLQKDRARRPQDARQVVERLAESVDRAAMSDAEPSAVSVSTVLDDPWPEMTPDRAPPHRAPPRQAPARQGAAPRASTDSTLQEPTVARRVPVVAWLAVLVGLAVGGRLGTVAWHNGRPSSTALCGRAADRCQCIS